MLCAVLHELVLAPACAPLLPSTQTNVTSKKFVKCSSPCLVEGAEWLGIMCLCTAVVPVSLRQLGGILRHVAQPRHAAVPGNMIIVRCVVTL